MTHHEPCDVVPSTAQMQQVLGERLRPIQFAAMRVIARLPARNLNELHGGTEPFPQRPRASVGLARLRRGRSKAKTRFGRSDSASPMCLEGIRPRPHSSMRDTDWEMVSFTSMVGLVRGRRFFAP